MQPSIFLSHYILASPTAFLAENFKTHSLLIASNKKVFSLKLNLLVRPRYLLKQTFEIYRYRTLLLISVENIGRQ